MTATALDDYRLLGRSGLRVSPLALGGAVFGEEGGYGANKVESRRIFDAYVDRGGNFIDSSNLYNNGTAEAWLGEFMHDKRDRIVVSTKYSYTTDATDPNAGGNHRKSIMRAVEDSLKRLQTDYIDVYMMHAWESRTPVEEIMRAHDDLVRAGKILYLGVSNAPAWIVTQAQCLAERYGWAALINLQTEYNLVNRTAEFDLLPMARAMGLGVTTWSPTAAGLLTGKYGTSSTSGQAAGQSSVRAGYVAAVSTERNLKIVDEVVTVADEIGCRPGQVALRWLLDQPDVAGPIVGCRSEAQLVENLACLEVSLTSDQHARLTAISQPNQFAPYDAIEGPVIPEQITGGLRIARR